MKMKIRIKYKLFFLIGMVFFIGCEEDLITKAPYEDYTFTTVDENGGEWNPILISDIGNISVAEPVDVNSPIYQAELEEIALATANLSESRQESINYWTNNPVIRWNEIALELIAKYNLIPGPNEDGTYTLPNPSNPAGDPPFPFAHPPYAVRALAYLSVAQFDGLIVAWRYKYQYKRPAPSLLNADIIAAYVDNGLPSYPSDGAVIATASKEILTAMFPNEADYLSATAEDHLQSLKYAGINTSSDIAAGIEIGMQVAELALNKASTDGMRNAQCSKAVSDSIQLSAFNRYGWKWDNIEKPVRPVGLTPLYSQVEMWWVPTLEEVRPPAPPDLDSQELIEDIEILKNYKDNMTNEWRRIANFWQDGLGTYTPPGHWNKFAIDYSIKYALNPLRTARVMAYLNTAMMDGGISCWDAKYYYHYPRPINIIPEFKTIAGTPNFPSYTSGHSVFSAAGAEVMTHMFPQEGSLFRDWAKEAAISRVYGGIHWTFDATVGTTQGIEVANYALQAARNDGAE